MHRFSLNPVDDAIPPAVGEDTQSAVLRIPEAIAPPGQHRHFVIQALGRTVALAVGAERKRLRTVSVTTIEKRWDRMPLHLKQTADPITGLSCRSVFSF
jgi:hypothetical protein